MRPGRRTQPRGLQHPRQYEGHPDRIGRAGPPVAGRIPGPAVDDDGRPFRGRGGRSRGGKDRLRHPPGPDATGPIRRPAAVEGRRPHNRASQRPGAPRAPRPVRTGEGTNRVGSSQAGRCPAPAQASRGPGRGRPCPHSENLRLINVAGGPGSPSMGRPGFRLGAINAPLRPANDRVPRRIAERFRNLPDFFRDRRNRPVRLFVARSMLKVSHHERIYRGTKPGPVGSASDHARAHP